MTIYGELLIGGSAVRGTSGSVHAREAATGNVIGPDFGGASATQVEQACALAERAFDTFRETAPEARAAFLETIAQNILDIGDELVERCMAETGLPRARIEGERGRTVNQLRLFAAVVRDGTYLDARIDPALPERQPLPRSDLRLRHIPLGPVAVFGASNFPLAFSVAGGDTASALAAGCPVVVKAHSAHLGTSELVGRALQAAVTQCGMPEGTFSLLFVDGYELGQKLVTDARIKAVGFTGSRRGGMALMKAAAARPEPIPVYAEMSSINPVLLFPQALEQRGVDIAKAFVTSLTMGAGQFCTNPGLVIGIDGPALDAFIAAAGEAVTASPAATMLTPGIHDAYVTGVAQVCSHAKVRTVARGLTGAACQGQAGLFSVTADDFLAHPELQDEIFGASSLVVRCASLDDMRRVVEKLEGQLTAALHMDESDLAAARSFLPLLERKVGRILVNGFGTGVEVCHAMVHGGPFPSTADGRSTSVGSLSIARFLRPVCYQDLPAALLPPALQDGNPFGIPRRIDGKPEAR
ncbi:aldehyde dehydrogenase (NADP(+)) [Noviherbaspirillum denitrificans]|uniref:2,5-dioxovalerate dehydrogenase n=1 Tax=Noviherbaspirillum denitrificans TaxID=1968433 RepID=A0A254TDC7_9BURK|nr:aldehyde dehydrogenase (NADP(+)) [Noviherbaspirillum denitrificans]OWW20555.1 2,5-dioxovalerate dehydrogenase [Noviherbaspirillum denitrificans]